MVPGPKGGYYANPAKAREFSLLQDAKDIDEQKAQRAKNKLLELNEHFLIQFIGGWIDKGHPSYSYDELLQDARLAFCKAIEAYDINVGISIRAYGKFYLLQLRRQFFNEYRKPTIFLFDEKEIEKALDKKSLSSMQRLDLTNILEGAIQVALTPLEAEVTTLHFLEGLTKRAIAKKRSCSERRIGVIVQHALPKLRAHLTQRGITLGFLELN